MIKRLLSFIVIVILVSCSSVEKYNQQISGKHSPEHIHKDIDYAYRKLKRLHPDLYWYISKDSLDEKISNLKKEIQNPISSKEFYKKLSPIIATIKQGHTAIYPPSKKQTKINKKIRGNRSYPFRPIVFHRVGDRLFIKKNYGKDNAFIVGAEVLSVEDRKTRDLLVFFETLHTGDGYNTTYMPRLAGKYFGSFYTKIYEEKDSVLVKLKLKDSIYTRYLHASYSKDKQVVLEDSVNNSLRKKVTKLEKEIAKKKQKRVSKFNTMHGYNAYSNTYNRNFEFLKSDSLPSTAYMKIRSFTKGEYEDFYKDSFFKIDSANCKNLIIDIRDNQGGRLAEIDELYSYLTDKDYVFVEKSKMTKRLSFLYPQFHSRSWIEKTGTTLLSPLIMVYQLFKVKKEKGVKYFKFAQNKAASPKSKPYMGKVYVLINSMSFSASSILSTHLKANKRAIFVGEETGGAYNGTVAGRFAIVELPNSKVKMRLGLMTINTPYIKEPDGYGIKPDVPFTDADTDIKNDKELDWIINDIQNSGIQK